jgi:hypothetical protein
MTERMLATLAAVGADREDHEPNGDKEDGADVGPKVINPRYGYRPEGDAEWMPLREWA